MTVTPQDRRTGLPLIAAFDLHDETPSPSVAQYDQVADPHLSIEAPKARASEMSVP
jgi:hypothetical protein